MEQGQREIDLAEAKVDAAKKGANEIAQMGLKIGDSLQSNMESAFQSLVDGTKSIKAAFADMAKSIIADIAKMIIKMMVMKMLQDTLGRIPGVGSFLGIKAKNGGVFSEGEKAKNGGVFSEGEKVPGYSTGGVAKGSRSGYPAILHGTEAVVPLPNNRSIPVDLQGNTGSTNNVVVNVSVDNDGQSSQNMQSDGTQGANLGKAIAAAVQQEIMNQRRNGGMLSPYGAS